jgi:sterol desaturase/sphingolipid hydroxylase (fatty acid hydroxylase superfamily)
MNADDIAALMIPLTWLAMMAVEWAIPGREWPRIRFWRLRGTAFFVIYMTLNALLPGWLPASFGEHALVPVGAWPVVAQVLVGYAVLSLANALLHRSYHRYDVLWRWVHQLHHSPQRVDSAGAVLLTPLEMLGYIAIFQLVVVLVFGLNPLAAAIVGYVSTVYSLFQHVNVRTPQWLGFIIQRPESHGVHHRRGVHGYNYSDVPLWDLLMGTFRNPRVFNGDVGFEEGALPRMIPLLVGRDANAEAYGARNRGTQAPNRNPA